MKVFVYGVRLIPSLPFSSDTDADTHVAGSLSSLLVSVVNLSHLRRRASWRACQPRREPADRLPCCSRQACQARCAWFRTNELPPLPF